MTKRKKSSAKRRLRRLRAKNLEAQAHVGAFARRMTFAPAGGEGRGGGGPAILYEQIPLPQNRSAEWRERENETAEWERENETFGEREKEDFYVRPTAKRATADRA
eukprot:5615829-Amphidinium_carterae.1